MATTPACISTGELPERERTARALVEAHARFVDRDEGDVASYVPALARVPADLFGLALVDTRGECARAGDADVPFTIQSVSKPFAFALVCQALGEDEARRKLGVNSTGLPFNSAIAVERSPDGTTNPMVNAGAIAAASLAPGDSIESKWAFLRDGLGRFAGRTLRLNDEVYRSESASNGRNLGIAYLLHDQGRVYCDPVVATEIYTRQCALEVTCHDLAVMAATLANGGVVPTTGEAVIDGVHCEHVLAVMVTAGFYEDSGDWLYDTGLPGKSGVSGAVIAVAPGKCGLAAFSPRLDASGNSVRGRLAARRLSEALGLNLFASRPAR